MTPITFWFDPVSPYAYLAFERLPQALAGRSYVVDYRPVLFAGLLQQWGQLGPAEIAPKREWTYRQVKWSAHRAGITLDMPAAHPFNPLPLLRLLVACGMNAAPNRHQCEAEMRLVWQGGLAADDPQRMAELAAALQASRDPLSDDVKRELRENTQAAAARGVFGVPTFELQGASPRFFWGYDALDMLAAALDADPWFDANWQQAAQTPEGIRRARKP
jgi:2-hydroxychromene-2-carboxylate isomerase